MSDEAYGQANEEGRQGKIRRGGDDALEGPLSPDSPVPSPVINRNTCSL